jgi:two-component system nitrate/nitrite response regulator NarL
MAKGRLILAGENGLFRAGLKHVLTDKSLDVVGEAATLGDALTLLRSLKPGADLIVYDQPETPARRFDELKRITREFPGVAVVILADRMDAAEVDMAVAAGASGFLPKNISPAALALSLQLIALGEKLFTAPAALWRNQPAEADRAANGNAKTAIQSLSHRQRQILEYLEAGLSNRAIALKLDVAEATVKVHVRSLMQRINVDNRTQAALWAKSHK